MADREILELAAEAAEVTITDWREVYLGVSPVIEHESGCGFRFWNPLTDDSDALKLALKLAAESKIKLQIVGDSVDVFWYHTGVWVPSTWSFRAASTPEEAFRKVVTHAAAEIGKLMKDTK